MVDERLLNFDIFGVDLFLSLGCLSLLSVGSYFKFVVILFIIHSGGGLTLIDACEVRRGIVLLMFPFDFIVLLETALVLLLSLLFLLFPFKLDFLFLFLLS